MFWLSIQIFQTSLIATQIGICFQNMMRGTRGAGSFLQKYREYISSPSKPTSLIQCFFDQKEEDV